MNKPDIDKNSESSNKTYPTCPKIPANRPWLAAYKKYNVRAQIQLPDNDSSLLEVFERNFAKFGARPAFTCMDKSLSYSQLDLYSRQVAAYLQSIGLKKGDKVAVMLPNILQYPIATLAILRAGMVLVNINPLYTSRELEHQLKDSGAAAIFILENFAKTLESVTDKGELEHIIVCSVGDMLGTVKGLLVNTMVRHVKKIVPKYKLAGSVSFKHALHSVSAHLYQRPSLDLSDLALLQYTGGTTGVAKGAMLSHGNLVANMLQLDVIIEAGFGDVSVNNDTVLTALPLYHVLSFMTCCIYAMYIGATSLLIANPRDLDDLVKQIGKHQPAFIPGVNTLYNALINHKDFAKLDFTNLKVSLGGGAAILPNVAKAWHEITGNHIIEGYGLTESSAMTSFIPVTIEEFTAKIGVPAASTDVILIDTSTNESSDDKNNKDEKEVPIGERGEICVKGPQVMLGYHNQTAETAASFTASGYFKTGDIGILDASGFIKIVDRKKDMILVSGFNVYPNEIEAVMSEHPAVAECGVIGVPHAASGEIPKLFVVKKSNGASQKVTEKELLDFSKSHLTGYKRPKQVEFIDELPKSPVGKILRKELRKHEGL